MLSHLAAMRRGQRGMMNVVPDEGRYLHDLIMKHRVKNVLEVGTSNGYSGIWMGLALRETGGNLTTLEIDQGRANLARENFRRTGLDSRIHLVLGDALKSLTRLDGTFDFVFIDAAKSEYVQYLELLLPRVSPGASSWRIMWIPTAVSFEPIWRTSTTTLSSRPRCRATDREAFR